MQFDRDFSFDRNSPQRGDLSSLLHAVTPSQSPTRSRGKPPKSPASSSPRRNLSTSVSPRRRLDISPSVSPRRSFGFSSPKRGYHSYEGVTPRSRTVSPRRAPVVHQTQLKSARCPSPRRHVNTAEGQVLLSSLTVSDLQSRARILSEQPFFRIAKQKKVVNEFWPAREKLEMLVFDTIGKDKYGRQSPFVLPVNQVTWKELCKTWSGKKMAPHTHLRKFRRGNTAWLFRLVGRVVSQQGVLSERDLGRARKIVKDIMQKRGRPGSAKYNAIYQRSMDNIKNHEKKGNLRDVLAKVFQKRLDGLHPYSGIEPGKLLSGPVTEDESTQHGIAIGTKMPKRINRWLMFGKLRTVDHFIDVCLRKPVRKEPVNPRNPRADRNHVNTNTRLQYFDCHAFERSTKVSLEISIRLWEYVFYHLGACAEVPAPGCPNHPCVCHTYPLVIQETKFFEKAVENIFARAFGQCFARENILQLGFEKDFYIFFFFK